MKNNLIFMIIFSYFITFKLYAADQNCNNSFSYQDYPVYYSYDNNFYQPEECCYYDQNCNNNSSWYNPDGQSNQYYNLLEPKPERPYKNLNFNLNELEPSITNKHKKPEFWKQEINAEELALYYLDEPRYASFEEFKDEYHAAKHHKNSGLFAQLDCFQASLESLLRKQLGENYKQCMDAFKLCALLPIKSDDGEARFSKVHVLLFSVQRFSAVQYFLWRMARHQMNNPLEDANGKKWWEEYFDKMKIDAFLENAAMQGYYPAEYAFAMQQRDEKERIRWLIKAATTRACQVAGSCFSQQAVKYLAENLPSDHPNKEEYVNIMYRITGGEKWFELLRSLPIPKSST